MSELEGRDLDRAIAEEMGWVQVSPTRGGCPHGNINPVGAHWHTSGRAFAADFLPTFHLSLDALRDGPERVLREAGWRLTLAFWNDGSTSAIWDKKGRPSLNPENAPTEAEARARATLAALRAMKEGGEHPMACPVHGAATDRGGA